MNVLFFCFFESLPCLIAHNSLPPQPPPPSSPPSFRFSSGSLALGELRDTLSSASSRLHFRPSDPPPSNPPKKAKNHGPSPHSRRRLRDAPAPADAHGPEAHRRVRKPSDDHPPDSGKERRKGGPERRASRIEFESKNTAARAASGGEKRPSRGSNLWRQRDPAAAFRLLLRALSVLIPRENRECVLLTP